MSCLPTETITPNRDIEADPIMNCALLLKCIVAIILFILIGQYCWRRRRQYLLSWKIAGPIGLPFIGSAHLFLNPKTIIHNLCGLIEKYGHLSAFWLGPRLVVYLQSPADIARCLQDPQCVNKGESYRFVNAFLGNGLVTLGDCEWRRHRKLLQPSFGRPIIARFGATIDRHVRQLVEGLEKFEEDGQYFDILEPLQRWSLDLIAETTMDRLMNTKRGENSALLAALKSVHEIASRRIFNIFLQPDILFRQTALYERQVESIQLLQETTTEIIAAKSREMKDHLFSVAEDDGLEKYNFIDRALRLSRDTSGLGLSDAEVRDEATTILVAGYETTANQLAYVCLMLAMHPECQDRVFEECRSVYLPDCEEGDIGDNPDAIHAEDLDPLTYLDMCIKETLRLFPVIPIMSRTTKADLNIGCHTIPPEVEVLINCYGLHRSAEHFEHPERFHPEHFLAETAANRHNYAYIPFGAGPRTCLGVRYANNALRIATIHILRRYRLHTQLRLPDLRTTFEINLNLINRHILRLERRKYL